MTPDPIAAALVLRVLRLVELLVGYALLICAILPEVCP